MQPGENPSDEDRRDPDSDLQQHVAQVWATPIADLDAVGLFRLGTACLEVAEATADRERCGLLSAVALTLLAYAGSQDQVIGARIALMCVRERAAAERRAETARVMAELEQQFANGDDDVTGEE